MGLEIGGDETTKEEVGVGIIEDETLQISRGATIDEQFEVSFTLNFDTFAQIFVVATT